MFVPMRGCVCAYACVQGLKVGGIVGVGEEEGCLTDILPKHMNTFEQ